MTEFTPPTFARELIGRVGEAEGKAAIRSVIDRYGGQVGTKALKTVTGMGLTNEIENYRLAHDLPSVGWEGAVAQTEQGPRRRVTYCPLAAAWEELDATELGCLYCYVDQAKFHAFNPRARLTHTCNMLDCDPYCEFHVRIEGPEDE